MAKNNGGFWDSELLVQEFVNDGGKSATKVKLVTKEDKTMIDVRKYVDGKGGTPGAYAQHTAKGMTIPVGDIMNVVGALVKANEFLAKEQAPKAKAKKRHRNKSKKSA